MKQAQSRWLATLMVATLIFALLPLPNARLSAQGGDQVFIPSIVVSLPPDFIITSPAAGLSISGTSLFAIQPMPNAHIQQVTFRAGDVVLGVDNTPGDGFQVFLDAAQLTAGSLTLAATASGPTGETTKSLSVTVVPNPPASAEVGASGGTLATASGNTIVIPPGTLGSATTISIADKSQAEVTADTGIDWDGMGVTFLGAIDVESSGPINGPLGISSVGFGNRIQPGQAVVAYRILPDADGDGVGELAVINGAEVAPNGTIVSSAVPEIAVANLSIRNTSGTIQSREQQTGLSGPPGTAIFIDGDGFNPISFQGNRVRFRALEGGESVEVNGTVDPTGGIGGSQRLVTFIPTLPPGPATLELLNQSTGAKAGPFEITIEAAPALGRPAAAIIDEALAAAIDAVSQIQSITDDSFAIRDLDHGIDQLTELRAQFQAMGTDPTPAEEEVLTEFATIIVNSDLVNLLSRNVNPQTSSIQACDLNALKDIGTGLALAGATLLAIYSAPVSIPLLALYGGGFLGGVGAGIFTGAGVIECLTPPPPPCGAAPAASGGGTAGMGSAPPPGGNGCGNASGGGGVQSAAVGQFENGRYTVRIFPREGTGSALTPFTGLTDPGGYFYIPLIPADEPFRAVATDQLTGASVSVDGVGPALNQSVFLNFDFFGAAGNLYEIQIGDTITDGVPAAGAGNIESPGGVDIYNFTGAEGQQVYFDLFGVDPALVQVKWKLTAPDGTVMFDRILNCCGGSDAGVHTLPQTGLYTLRVGDGTSAGTGPYGLTLWNVPPPHEFDIAVGDTITNSVTGPGAGNIESPGVKDIYTFDATTGQQVYFDLFGVVTGLVQVNWKLIAPDDTVIFDRILNCCGGSDAGVHTIPATGTYTIIVGDDTDAGTGTYGFKLWHVPPPDEFSIAIGDTITNGVPGAGAGNIESPGVKDIYTFNNATANQVVDFDLFGVVADLVQVNWKLIAPDDTVVFDRILNCCGGSAPGEITLEQTGIYTIIVGDDTDAGVGTYGFELGLP